MFRISRRVALAFGLFGLQVGLSACGGSETDPAATDAAALPGAPTSSDATKATATAVVPPWDAGQTLSLFADSVASFDLNTTLPDGVPRGGHFSVSSSGAELPAGVKLSTSGVLSATSGARIGPVNGVVFAYEEA